MPRLHLFHIQSLTIVQAHDVGTSLRPDTEECKDSILQRLISLETSCDRGYVLCKLIRAIAHAAEADATLVREINIKLQIAYEENLALATRLIGIRPNLL